MGQVPAFPGRSAPDRNSSRAAIDAIGRGVEPATPAAAKRDSLIAAAALIVEQRKRGITRRDIAAAYGVSMSYLKNTLASLGIRKVKLNARVSRGKVAHRLDKCSAQIEQLLAAGESYRSIARILDVSDVYLVDNIRRLGLRPARLLPPLRDRRRQAAKPAPLEQTQ